MVLGWGCPSARRRGCRAVGARGVSARAAAARGARYGVGDVDERELTGDEGERVVGREGAGREGRKKRAAGTRRSGARGRERQGAKGAEGQVVVTVPTAARVREMAEDAWASVQVQVGSTSVPRWWAGLDGETRVGLGLAGAMGAALAVVMVARARAGLGAVGRGWGGEGAYARRMGFTGGRERRAELVRQRKSMDRLLGLSPETVGLQAAGAANDDPALDPQTLAAWKRLVGEVGDALRGMPGAGDAAGLAAFSGGVRDAAARAAEAYVQARGLDPAGAARGEGGVRGENCYRAALLQVYDAVAAQAVAVAASAADAAAAGGRGGLEVWERPYGAAEAMHGGSRRRPPITATEVLALTAVRDVLVRDEGLGMPRLAELHRLAAQVAGRTALEADVDFGSRTRSGRIQRFSERSEGSLGGALRKAEASRYQVDAAAATAALLARAIFPPPANAADTQLLRWRAVAEATALFGWSPARAGPASEQLSYAILRGAARVRCRAILAAVGRKELPAGYVPNVGSLEGDGVTAALVAETGSVADALGIPERLRRGLVDEARIEARKELSTMAASRAKLRSGTSSGAFQATDAFGVEVEGRASAGGGELDAPSGRDEAKRAVDAAFKAAEAGVTAGNDFSLGLAQDLYNVCRTYAITLPVREDNKRQGILRSLARQLLTPKYEDAWGSRTAEGADAVSGFLVDFGVVSLGMREADSLRTYTQVAADRCRGLAVSALAAMRSGNAPAAARQLAVAGAIAATLESTDSLKQSTAATKGLSVADCVSMANTAASAGLDGDVLDGLLALLSALSGASPDALLD